MELNLNIEGFIGGSLLAGGGAFTPASLDNQVFWIEYGELSESSGEVSSWTNKFNSNANPFIPVAARNTPNTDGDNGVLFTRANNEILRASAITGIVDWSFHIIFKANGTTSDQTLLSNLNTTSGLRVSIVSNTIKVQTRNNLGTISKTFAFTDTASYHVLTIKKQNFGKLAEGSNSAEDVGRMVIKLDNVVKANFGNLNNTYASTLPFDLGSDASNNSFDGYIKGMVFTKDYITEEEEENIYTYFNSNFGLSVTTTMPEYIFTSPASGLNSTLGISATLGTVTLKGDLFWYSNKAEAGSVIGMLIHDFPGSAPDLGTQVGPRMAKYFNGCFLFAPNMRGKGTSTGTQDCGGQEVYDLYDVYNNFKLIFSKLSLSDSKLFVSGWSGGGGDSIGLASKFPDLAQLHVSNYGISDYGYSGTTSWYVNLATTGYKATMDAGVGGTPRTDYLNEYSSRNHVDAIAKNFIGKLYLFHDTGDSSVEVGQSQLVNAQFIAEGKSAQCVYNETNTGSAVRWTHTGVPNDANNIAQAEPYWKDETLTPSSIADSGEVVISGLVRTKKFFILLGNGTSGKDGQNRKATLAYDWVNNTYTITPQLETGATDMTVSITVIGGAHDGKTASGTISTETEFIPT